MADDDPRPPPSSQTIQVDALSDVELLDQSAEGDAMAPPNVSLPPPLPRKPKETSTGVRAAQLVLVVAVTGGLGALGAQFIAPAPAPVAPAPAVSAPPPPAVEPPVNHVVLEEGLVIRAEPGAEPDAGLPAAPE